MASLVAKLLVICVFPLTAMIAEDVVKCKRGEVAFETRRINGKDVDVLISGPGCPEARLSGLPLAAAVVEPTEPPETVPEAPKLVEDSPESVASEGELSTASSGLGEATPKSSGFLPWLLMMLALLMVGGAFAGHRLYDQKVRQPRLAVEERARLVAEEEAKRKAEDEARRAAEEEEQALRDAEEGLRKAAEQEALRLAREAAERQAREEAERLAKDEADRKSKEEEERAAQQAMEADELKAKEQAAEERRRKQQEEADARAEAKRREDEEAAKKKGCCAPCGCGAKAAEPARPQR